MRSRWTRVKINCKWPGLRYSTYRSVRVAESKRHGSGILIVGFIVPQAQFSCRCTPWPLAPGRTCICLSDRQANCDPSLKGQIGWAKSSSVALWTGVLQWRGGDRLQCLSDVDMRIRLLQAFGSSTSKVVTMRRVLQLAGRDEVWLSCV